MLEGKDPIFDVQTFLAKPGRGRSILRLAATETFFSQGDPASSVIFLHSGRAKLAVSSAGGKEAIIRIADAGDFLGEESLAVENGVRAGTASAITDCVGMRVERSEMRRVMRNEGSLADIVVAFLLARSSRLQADLVDQLFNSSEKRLARLLLLMAEFGDSGEPQTLIPYVTQESLAQMVGTTRSRISFFMSRFNKLGLIDYGHQIIVHKSLLHVILKD